MPESFGDNLIFGRHNAILDVFKNANLPEDAKIFQDEQLPRYSSDPLLRPDVVVVDHRNKRATIVDVTYPFESSPSALQRVCDSKRSKYDSIKCNLEANGSTVVVDALVMGLVGSLNPLNATVHAALYIFNLARSATVGANSNQSVV